MLIKWAACLEIPYMKFGIMMLSHRNDGSAYTMYELSLPGDEISYHREWWHMGKKLNCSSQKEFEKLLKLKVFW
jgi:hypothetical protein